jgi:lipoprotein-releasing system permease protein
LRLLLLLASRYLLGIKRRTHVAAVSSVSFGGMALGAAALVLTLALLEGFQATIRHQLTETGPHARLRPKVGATLPVGTWLETLRQRHPELQVRATSGGPVWCLAGTEAAPAELVAVDTLSRVEVNRVLAARLGVTTGSHVVVAAPRLQLGPLGPAPVRREVLVEAVRSARPGEERAVILMPLAVGRAILGSSPPREVELSGPSAADAWQVASLVQADVPDGVEIVSFAELNRPLLAALALERVMIGFGVALVMAVAALNLLCNLSLLAAEKRVDVALLSALGLEPGRVRTLFLLIGLGVGALGGLVGTGLGAAAAVILDRTRALPLPSGVFIVAHVPFAVAPSALLVVVGISLLAALLASLPPAAAAARRDVLEGLAGE